MSLPRRLSAMLRHLRKPSVELTDDRPPASQLEALIQAHGMCLALVATILERERIIASSDLAHALSEFADLTAQDQPDEGRILAVWASCLQDSAATLRDFPVVH